MDKPLIQLVGSEATEVPAWFLRRLRDIDTALVVYWNRFKQQFCIDRCVKGSDCLSSDHLSCEKTNVLLFPHMSESALEKLKSMDAWTNYGGNDEAALLRARRKHENKLAEHNQKVDAEIRESYAHAAKDNRVQLNEAFTLIKRHDTARIH